MGKVERADQINSPEGTTSDAKAPKLLLRLPFSDLHVVERAARSLARRQN
jgi:hypothetical protein